jgi:hypothetical protein
MRNLLFAAVSALAMSCAIPAIAQTQTQAQTQATGPGMSASEWNELRDSRIAVIKFALQLRPDQQQFWPPLEAAIRARSEARQKRLADLQARLSKPAPDMDPIQIVKLRADMLAQRAEGLKKLADAWQPLYATLDQDQKRRMRIVAVLMLREVRDAIDSRRMDDEEMDDDF